MKLQEVIDCIDAVFISPKATVTQLKHEEDDELYQVWRIDFDDSSYILKEAKGDEVEIYQSFLIEFKECVPVLYQIIACEKKTYLLMEYVEGENLCKCNRSKLTCALDALISLQQKNWMDLSVGYFGDLFDKSVLQRQDRGKYLHDSLLEEVYEKFLKVYQSIPKTLCHDDLLPFNIIVSKNKAVLIDWESGGILPYPASFARLIAHGEDDEDALFCMSQADKNYAINYYYDHLLKEKGILYTDWINTLEYFLFYEYCEWVFVGNKYNAADGDYYKKYLPKAKQQAVKILRIEHEKHGVQQLNESSDMHGS